VILPYSSATQSGVIVDSYKFGKPVIAFSVGGIKEQIINGETGFLIPNLRIDLFEKALYKISSMTENEYDKIMNSSYDFGYRKYSSNKVKEAFINFFYKDGFRKN
jgi:glycosyltransferase involved in cell wall biosynthesis